MKLVQKLLSILCRVECLAVLLLCASSLHASDKQHSSALLEESPSTSPIHSEALEDTLVGNVNACDIRELKIPKGKIPQANDSSFNPLIIPQFLLIDVPFAFLKQIAWTVMPENSKAEMIAEGISEQAKSDSLVSSLLSPQDIQRASKNLGSHYGSRIVAPSSFDVKKDASLVFVNEIIQSQLRNLGLPCQNSKEDFPALTRGLLRGFETCMNEASNDDQYLKCTKNLEQTAHFHVGYLALQIMLRDALLNPAPKDPQEKHKIEQNITSALKIYERCAFNRVLAKNRNDKELQTKVCVGEAVVRTVRTIGADTIESRLKPLISDDKKRTKLKNDVFSNLGAGASSCPLASLLQNSADYSEPQYQILYKTFSKPDGVRQFKNELFSCADQLSETSGNLILQETILHHPALIRQYSNSSGKIDSTGQLKISQTSERALKEAYQPCIARLKATKATRQQSIINPSECEKEVILVVATQLIEEELPTRLHSMIVPFKDPESQNRLRQKKNSAVKNFELCKKNRKQHNKISLLQCLTDAINVFSGDYAVAASEEKLGKGYLRSHPELEKDVRNLITSCVKQQITTVKELETLSDAMSNLGLKCNAAVQARIVPTIAEDQIQKNFEEQGLDASKFIKSVLPQHLQSFRAELKNANSEQTQNNALEHFQAKLSTAALKDIAVRKTEEVFPINSPNQNPAEKNANKRIHQRVADLIADPQRQSALLDPKTSSRALAQTKDQLIAILAIEKLKRVLGENLKAADSRDKITQKLKRSLRICQHNNLARSSDSANPKDCLLEFEKTATWEIYRAAVSEGISEVLAKEMESDPGFGKNLKKTVAARHMNSNVESLLKNAASSEEKRDALTLKLQNQITGTVVKEIFRHKVADLLPAAPDRFRPLKPAEDKLDACLEKSATGPSRPTKAPLTSQKNSSDFCVGAFIKNGAMDLAEQLVMQSGKKYVSKPQARRTVLKIRSRLHQGLQVCLDQIQGSPQSAAFADSVVKCATLHASVAAIDLGILSSAHRIRRPNHPFLQVPENDVEKLLVNVDNACFYGERLQCNHEAKQLKQRLHAVGKNSLMPASELQSSIYQSDLMDSMITGALSQELEEVLNAKLQPHKSSDDKVYEMESIILKSASHEYLSSLLSTPQGKLFLKNLKNRMRSEKKYNPATDPVVANDFKQLLFESRGPGSFTDLMLRALAKPSYDAKWDEELKTRWAITLGLGMWWKNIRPSAIHYENVMRTPSGQRAREYFYEKVIVRSLTTLAAEEQEALRVLLPAPLGKKIISGKGSLTEREFKTLKRVLYENNQMQLIKKISPISRAEIAKIRDEIESLLNQAASETR